MYGVTSTELASLQASTPPEEVKQRQQNTKTGSIQLSYVDARYVQELLDNVLEPQNWQVKFEDPDHLSDGIRCGIGILVQRSPATADSNAVVEWVWKWDVGTTSDIEGTKGAHSDAFKRAGVQWGIARDLYDPQSETRLELAGVQQQPQPIRQRVQTTRTIATNDPGPNENDGSEEDVAWACPDHGQVKLVPAGTSKKPPYRAYDAFFACPVQNCPQKGPSVDANGNIIVRQ